MCVDGKTKAKQGASHASISLSDDQMNLDSIDIRTGAKSILSSSNIIPAYKIIILQKVLEFLHNYC